MFPAPTRTFQILQLLTCFYLSLPLLLFSPLLMFVFSFQFCFFFATFTLLTVPSISPSAGLVFPLPLYFFCLHPSPYTPFFFHLSSCLTCFPYQGIRGDIKSPAALTLFCASASLSLSPSLSSLHPVLLSVLSSISPSHEGLREDGVSCEVGC